MPWFVCAALAALALPPGPCAQAAPPAPARESDVKAAAINNIIAFVEWPAGSFVSDESPLVVGILGHGPIASLLDNFVEGDTWHGRKVVIERYAKPDQIRACHVLFLARSEHVRWTAARAATAGRPILTISEAENFARNGGIVQLAIERNKLHLTINLGVARASGLTISSKVLRLAEVLDNKAP